MFYIKQLFMNIAVYCSSKEGLNQSYESAAEIIGGWIGCHQATLVYGGIGLGLMKVIASAVKLRGGRVVGVIPSVRRGCESEDNDENLFASDLNDRKSKMISLGDVFIVLPGGYGTVDELMSTLSSLAYSGVGGKPVLVVNQDGLYDHLLAQIRVLTDRGLIDNPSFFNRMKVVESAAECCQFLDDYFENIKMA